ncbi:MAG: helix-turn-helix transcriptional regulator [Hahellaceae bacterium]|nr:helix-turn-helix transcriptional regulator [Hahellaceae bacterium]MCP5212779.1 helix-turn-helix transcriptional regulator [Hahellaceae bacterium]
MYEANVKKLPERLRQRRKLREISIRRLSELTGISPRQYAKYERSGPKMVMPPIDKLLIICNILDCTVDELLYQEGTVHTIVGESRYIRTRKKLLKRLDTSAEFNFFVLSAMSSSDEKLRHYNEITLIDAEESERPRL